MSREICTHAVAVGVAGRAVWRSPPVGVNRSAQLCEQFSGRLPDAGASTGNRDGFVFEKICRKAWVHDVLTESVFTRPASTIKVGVWVRRI